MACLKQTSESVISYCNLSCGCNLCCLHFCARGLLRAQDSFIWAEINIKLWPSSINPFVHPSNSSPERKCGEAGRSRKSYGREGKRCVKRAWLMDGKVITPLGGCVIYCQLLVSSCLVSFMAVITEWMHEQTALPKIPVSHIKHMHKLHFNLSQQAKLPSGQYDAGSEGSHWEK